MVRFFINTLLSVIANALGLLMASIIIDGFSLHLSGFLSAVAVFSISSVILGPLVIKLTLQNIPALMGGVALVTTFVSLLLTTLLTDGLVIDGVSSWVLSTLIVWLFSLIAVVVLPMFLFKQALESRDKNSAQPKNM